MAVQQSKVSKRRVRNRRAANRYRGIESSACPVCGVARLPHRICLACGHYGQRQVLTVDSK